MTKAFLTGSRAYGVPSENSDVDLCVLVDEPTLAVLRGLAVRKEEVAKNGPDGRPRSLSSRDRAEDPGDSLYFGGASGLNLICHTNPHAFAAWRAATLTLAARRPVTREEAIREIKAQVKASIGLAKQAGSA